MQKWLCLLAIVILFGSCRSQVRYEEGEPVYRVGDDPKWAAKIENEKQWSADRKDVNGEVFWARKTVEIIDQPNGRLGMQVAAFGAHEVYWDGVLVAENGKLGLKGRPEIPGTENFNVLIPDSLSAKGKHVVAFRMTQAYQNGVERGIDVKFENYEVMLQWPLVTTAFMNLMAGAFFVAGIYFLLLYFNSSKQNLPILVFAIICLLFFSLLIIEYVKFYIQIPYTHFYWRLELIGWHTFTISALVPFYFALQFNFRYKQWLFWSVLVSLFSIYSINYGHYDFSARYYAITMWVASLFVVFYSVYHKRKGAIVVLVGLLFTVFVHQSLVYDFSLFLSFSVIMFCMLYLHSLAMKELEQEHELSLVVSSRLRLELLRKNIQPHFLKNTLTSLIDWVEEGPKEGAKFIQALAEEFDIMNHISEQQLIPIAKEIELCKTHIQVMAFRKEINYLWKTTGIDETKSVPPAIFHTLLENGITHSIPINGQIAFELIQMPQADGRTYIFKTFAQNRISARANNEGNGLGYIKARLKESYGEKWKLSSQEMTGGWITTLKIYDK